MIAAWANLIASIMSDFVRAFGSDLVRSAISAVSAVFVFSLGINAVRTLWRARNVTIPFDVAVIGLPRSGKTTLITTMFQVMFYQRFLAQRILLRGSETIDRVNQNLATIKMGQALGPTGDQEMFAYRTDVTASGILLHKTYRVAIGDFAGEYSDKLGSEKEYKALYETTFFKWVMSADAYIFVLDCAAFLKDGASYAAVAERELRSAWQRLAEFHVEGGKKIRAKKLAIVLNKADLLAYGVLGEAPNIPVSLGTAPQNSGRVRTSESVITEPPSVWRLGFGSKVPPTIELDSTVLRELTASSEDMFKSIIAYFRLQSDSVRVIPVSSFALIDGQPIGVKDLIEFILPH